MNGRGWKGDHKNFFGKRVQQWWRTRDWTDCMIQKQGGSRGGEEKVGAMSKKMCWL